MRILVGCLLSFSVFVAPLLGHDETSGGITVEQVEKSDVMWNGTPLPAYPNQPAEITVLKITIPPKSRLPWHKHPVINFGYLLEGELYVKAEDGTELRMQKGDPIVELVDQWHYGENPRDEPAVILVFYAGAKGEPLTVLRDDIESAQ